MEIDLELIIDILGYTSTFVIPALIALVRSGRNLGHCIEEARKDDGKIDEEELEQIIEQGGFLVRNMAKFLKLFR